MFRGYYWVIKGKNSPKNFSFLRKIYFHYTKTW